jgi:hypothetical protein
MKKTWIIMGILVTIFFVITAMVSSNSEKQRYNYIGEELLLNNLSRLSLIFQSPKPALEKRPFEGKENAQLILVAYLDPTSQSSIDFIEKTYPFLYNEYISTGKMKFYGKSVITTQDYALKNERFIYAKSEMCVGQLNFSAYYQFYFAMMKKEPKGLINLAQEYGISESDFLSCYKSNASDELKRDSLEGERIMADALSPQIYFGLGRTNLRMDGIPKIDTLNKTIRRLEISIGD